MSKRAISTLLAGLCLLIAMSAVLTISPLIPGMNGMHSIDGMHVTAEAAEPGYTEFEDLSGKSIGMITGAPFEELVKSKIPNVKEILFFGSAPDMLAALKAGKVDAYLMNNAVGTLLVNMDSSVAIFVPGRDDLWYCLQKEQQRARPLAGGLRQDSAGGDRRNLEKVDRF